MSAPMPLGADAEWTLDLPFDRPPLMANGRESWRVRARRTKEIRWAAFCLAREAKVPRLGRAVVTLHWYPATKRRRDDTGPAPTVKAAVDGLVDAGVFADDTHDIVTHRVVIEPVSSVAALELVIQEARGGAGVTTAAPGLAWADLPLSWTADVRTPAQLLPLSPYWHVVLAEDMCRARQRANMSWPKCMRIGGHPGEHVATAGSDRAIARWPA